MAKLSLSTVGVLVTLSLGSVSTSGAPQSLNSAEESIKQLVVMVESTLSGDKRVGSGIIFGFERDQLYIVTADHVVRQAAREAEEVRVRLFWSPDKSIKATLLAHRDTALDVAVLSVSELGDLEAKSDELPFDRMGDPNSLRRGDLIYLLGNPHGKSWRVNTTPEQFIEARGDSLEFESNLIAPGHSGGALLNTQRELLGMLKSDHAPYGDAVSITSILKKVKDWGYPVSIGRIGIRVASGDADTCLISTGGVARCWGRNHPDRLETIQGANFKSISVGAGHVCGTDRRGKAYCIGDNESGQLGKGTIRECCYPEDYESAQPVRGELTFLSVSAGRGHTCGVSTDGSAYCWGAGGKGQIGNGSRNDSPVPVKVSGDLSFSSVSAGWLYTCGVTTDSSLYCWGMGFNSMVPVRGEEVLKFKSISAGMHHLCGVTIKGGAYCAGSNEYGQLGNSSDRQQSEEFVPVLGGLIFKSVSTSEGGFTCGLTITRASYCWGKNEEGQLGDGSKRNSNRPVAVSGGLKFTSVSTGIIHACGVTTEDSLYCWGSNRMGAMPLGSPEGSSVPFKVIK